MKNEFYNTLLNNISFADGEGDRNRCKQLRMGMKSRKRQKNYPLVSNIFDNQGVYSVSFGCIERSN